MKGAHLVKLGCEDDEHLVGPAHEGPLPDAGVCGALPGGGQDSSVAPSLSSSRLPTRCFPSPWL